jgi:hypothetical protein
MGWNSWISFAGAITESEVKAQAEAMVRHLARFGYEHVVIDAGWYCPPVNTAAQDPNQEPSVSLDEYGRFVPNETRFPSSSGGRGLAPLADYIHGLGLKLGIHVMRGISRAAVAQNLPILGSRQRAADVADKVNICPWWNATWGLNWAQPGAQAYYNSIFTLYAQWKVDFIKIDDMVGVPREQTPAPYYEKDVEGLVAAVQASGRSIVLSLSPGDHARPEFAPHMQRHVEMARVSPDFWDTWGELKRQFTLAPDWTKFIGNGFWPDLDMMPLGRIGLRFDAKSRGPDRETRYTPDEQRLLMTLWAIARSPLIMGGDLTRLTDSTLALLTNEEVLRVNQASRNNRQLFRHEDHVAWIGEPEDGSGKYLAIFNLADNGPTEISISTRDLGIRGPCRIRDLWARRDQGTVTSEIKQRVPAHGAVLLHVRNSK